MVIVADPARYCVNRESMDMGDISVARIKLFKDMLNLS